MTDEIEIPDDVVERVWKAWWKAWHSSEPPRTLDNAMRAAGRVFVEWEREQCARIADADTQGNGDEYDYFDIGKVVAAKNIAATIRARSQKG